MEKNELMALGADEELADMIVSEQEKMAASYERQIEDIKKEYEIERILDLSGARNVKAVRALITGREPDDVRLEIEKLKSDEETRFLFERKGSFQPARASERLPDTGKAKFEDMLREARRKNNTVEAIRIKQLAASNGVMLI